MIDLAAVKFNADGLVPAVAQDKKTGQVLMLAYMNRESLQKTLTTGQAWYWSRSRQELWEKGATSGHIQKVHKITLDCDGDALLLEVEQIGPACHTGEQSCFHSLLYENEKSEQANFDTVIEVLYGLIKERKNNPKEGSYTSYLFSKGVDKICKKVGEEAAEVIIAAKNNSRDELVYELADLCYHALVLMAEMGVTPGEIREELGQRRK